jgi:hypothetical protein
MKAPVITALGLLVSYGAVATCIAASVSDPKSTIEGVYILDEWYSDGKPYRPPQVEGRLILQNGVIAVILIDTIHDSKKTYNASFGSYSLAPDSFSYKFEARVVSTQTPDNITVSRAIPWQGMRQFTLKHDDNLVRVKYGSQAEFDFNPGGLTYSENGKVLRVYHRVNNQ